MNAEAIMRNCGSKGPARHNRIERNCSAQGQKEHIDTGCDTPSRSRIGAQRAVHIVSGMQLSDVSFELFVGGVDFLQSCESGGPRKGQSSFYFFILLSLSHIRARVFQVVLETAPRSGRRGELLNRPLHLGGRCSPGGFKLLSDKCFVQLELIDGGVVELNID